MVRFPVYQNHPTEPTTLILKDERFAYHRLGFNHQKGSGIIGDSFTPQGTQVYVNHYFRFVTQNTHQIYVWLSQELMLHLVQEIPSLRTYRLRYAHSKHKEWQELTKLRPQLNTFKAYLLFGLPKTAHNLRRAELYVQEEGLLVPEVFRPYLGISEEVGCTST